MAFVAVLLGTAACFVEIGPLQHLAGGVGSLVAAVSVGAWAFVLCGMLAKRMDVEGYNRRWGGRDDGETVVAEEPEEEPDAELAGEALLEADAPAMSVRRRERSSRIAAGAIALAIVSAAGLVALVAFRPPLSWYAWIVLALVCAAAWIAVRAAQEARRA